MKLRKLITAGLIFAVVGISQPMCFADGNAPSLLQRVCGWLGIGVRTTGGATMRDAINDNTDNMRGPDRPQQPSVPPPHVDVPVAPRPCHPQPVVPPKCH